MTHIIYITRIIYITHILNLFFEAYKTVVFIKFFLYIKLTTHYYQKHKEKLRKEAREMYRKLSEEEKDKMRKNARERYQNFTEEEKEKRRNKNISKGQKRN